MYEVSIILPVYNAEKKIEKTLNSIIEQDCKIKYQIIIVNDGSKDSSGNICERYNKIYRNITYVKTENQGVSNARNVGLEHAKSNYVMFIDSDDTYEKRMIEKMYNTIKNNEKFLVVCGYDRIYENKDYILKINGFDFKEYLENCEKKIKLLKNNNLFNQVWNKIYDLNIIKKNNILFEKNVDIGEDKVFNIKYLEKIKGICCIEDRLYNYNYSSGGLNAKTNYNNFVSKLNNSIIEYKFYRDKLFDCEAIYREYLINILSYLIFLNKQKQFNKENIINIACRKRIETELLHIEKKSKIITNKICAKILRTKKIYILRFLTKIFAMFKYIVKDNVFLKIIKRKLDDMSKERKKNDLC